MINNIYSVTFEIANFISRIAWVPSKRFDLSLVPATVR